MSDAIVNIKGGDMAHFQIQQEYYFMKIWAERCWNPCINFLFDENINLSKDSKEYKNL